jgi:hypothetical protein
MTATINASNSGSGGLISTGDASGSLALQTAGTTAITVDTSQNVSVGTTTALVTGAGRGNITVNGSSDSILSFGIAGTNTGWLYSSSSGMELNSVGSKIISFTTNSAERMRIDSSGNVGIGTQPSYKLDVVSGATRVAQFVNGTGTSGYSSIFSSIQSTGNNTSTYHFQGNTSGVGNWYLWGNGTTTFSSDQRLKKNIETTRDGYLEDLAKLRVVKYNWKNDADGTPKELGLIAQDVEQVFAGLVQDDIGQISDEDTTIYKQLKVSVLPFMLLKAIQELKAINDQQAETINALTARVVALESRGTV